MSNVVKQFAQYLEGLGLELELVVVLAAAGFSFLLLLVLGVASFFQEKRAHYRDSLLQSGFSGRLEKIERNLNELRAEVLRALELLRIDITSLQSAEKVELEGSEELEEVPAVAENSCESIDTPQPNWESDAITPLVLEQERLEPEGVVPEPLTERLRRSRVGFWNKFKAIFAEEYRSRDELLEQLEAVMIESDLGVRLADRLIAELRINLKTDSSLEQADIVNRLKKEVAEILSDAASGGEIDINKPADAPTVVLLVGVNGVGKTTTAAKLASIYKERGFKVLLVAADTYRAAAVEQLVKWGERINVPVVTGADNAKPQTIVFDGMKRALEDKADLVIIDTAGRLHTKSNLMQELQGIRGVITRHLDSAPHEVLLVVDGTTGQNAISQAREFNEVSQLSGLVITKLDGTARGGTVVSIKNELGIPVRYIGVGEAACDLRPFVVNDFVEALFTTVDSSTGELVELSAHARERRKRSNL